MADARLVGGVPGQPHNPKRRAFHAVTSAQVARYWWSDLDHGLAPEEIKKRLARLGPNRLASRPPPSAFRLLGEQLSDATVLRQRQVNDDERRRLPRYAHGRRL
jgi:hypothetical protein